MARFVHTPQNVPLSSGGKLRLAVSLVVDGRPVPEHAGASPSTTLLGVTFALGG